MDLHNHLRVLEGMRTALVSLQELFVVVETARELYGAVAFTFLVTVLNEVSQLFKRSIVEAVLVVGLFVVKCLCGTERAKGAHRVYIRALLQFRSLFSAWVPTALVFAFTRY